MDALPQSWIAYGYINPFRSNVPLHCFDVIPLKPGSTSKLCPAVSNSRPSRVHFPWRYEHRWCWTLKCWQEPLTTCRPNHWLSVNQHQQSVSGKFQNWLKWKRWIRFNKSVSPIKKRVSVWFFKYRGIETYFWSSVLELVLPDPSKLRVHPRSFTTQIWFPLCVAKRQSFQCSNKWACCKIRGLEYVTKNIHLSKYVYIWYYIMYIHDPMCISIQLYLSVTVSCHSVTRTCWKSPKYIER